MVLQPIIDLDYN